jgi:hypothetical protein
MFNAAQVNEELRINNEIRAITDPVLQEKVRQLYIRFLNLTIYRFYRLMTGATLGMLGFILVAGTNEFRLKGLLLGLFWLFAIWLLADTAVLGPVQRRSAGKTKRQIAEWLRDDPGYVQALLIIREIAPVYTAVVGEFWRKSMHRAEQ